MVCSHSRLGSRIRSWLTDHEAKSNQGKIGAMGYKLLVVESHEAWIGKDRGLNVSKSLFRFVHPMWRH